MLQSWKFALVAEVWIYVFKFKLQHGEHSWSRDLRSLSVEFSTQKLFQIPACVVNARKAKHLDTGHNRVYILSSKPRLSAIRVRILFSLHNKLARSRIWCNPFALSRVGIRRSDHDALRSAGINSVVSFKSSPFQGWVPRELFPLSRPSHLPWWWLTSSAFFKVSSLHAYCPISRRLFP